MPISIQKNIPLASFTTFKIGGPAKYFCEVKTIDDLEEALGFAEENGLPIFVLGGGSNLLVSDSGFQGLVIKISSFKYQLSGLKVRADAGVSLGRIVIESVSKGLRGMEWAAGVPGTIGGAIRGNAGCFGGEMKDVVESVMVFDTDTMKTKKISGKKCGFGYRESIFKKNRNFIIWSVSLKLKKGDAGELKAKIKDVMECRRNRQHLDLPSAGSIFKNISDSGAIKKISLESPDAAKNAKYPNGTIAVAYLLDECGLKGVKIGGAMISHKHSNFIVNFDNAMAEDIIILMGIMKERVMVKFGVNPEAEVRLVGF